MYIERQRQGEREMEMERGTEKNRDGERGAKKDRERDGEVMRAMTGAAPSWEVCRGDWGKT